MRKTALAPEYRTDLGERSRQPRADADRSVQGLLVCMGTDVEVASRDLMGVEKHTRPEVGLVLVDVEIADAAAAVEQY